MAFIGASYQQNVFCWYARTMASIANIELLGGHPALDFLNTVDDRLSPRPDEYLRDAGDLAAWGVAAGLLEDPRASAGDDELVAAIALRAHVTALLDARATDRAAAAADREALARAVAEAYAAGSLEQDPGGSLRWRWDPSELATVRHRVATAAAELLASPAADRIGRCDGQECGWFFLDTTKRGNRRWCSMSDCGQEAKSARRRASGGGRRAT
jgi:predicted RNA-binding Zn ribbon-like protein